MDIQQINSNPLKDSYQSIDKPSKETLIKDRNSKFFGYAFPVLNQDHIIKALDIIKIKHPSANHYCHAWQLGIENKSSRYNDDGEPKHTAGIQIYGQIKAYELTNILLVSVRYFGGTKLGKAGLIKAYKNSAKITIENSTILKKTINVIYQLNYKYDLTNKVTNILKENNVKIISQKFEIGCECRISIRKKDSEFFLKMIKNIHEIKIFKCD